MSGSARRGRPLSRQRGAALVTVLLVFALAATLAAAMLERGYRNQRSVANLIGSRQAWHYALGGEALARQLLAQDAVRNTRGVDTLQEEWAAPLQPFELDNGEIAVTISDLQGRFNLNSVVDAEGAPRPEMTAALARLLAAVGAPARLAAQWQDWVDADQVISDGGAEDGDYSDRRTAGQAEADISTLWLLRDIDADAYERVAPQVATLPPGTPVNVNTAGLEVLQSLSSIIDASAAGRIAARRARNGFQSADEFLLFVGGDAALAERIAVGSHHFEVIVTVRHGDYWLRLRSQLERDPDNGTITVTARHRIPLDATLGNRQNATRGVAARS